MNSISRETVRKVILSMDQQAIADARFGKRVGKKLHGNFYTQPRADAPMNRVYIDNTQLDLYVVVETSPGKHRKLRPWLTLASDDHTSMAVGFALSFKAPKAEEVLAALRHTILPKAYTEKWVGSSLRLVWEVMGIPDEIVIDNGLDLQAAAFYSACLALGISVTTTPPMEPWRKGRIERIFGTLNTKLLHCLPGSTFGKTDNTKKNEYSPKDFAALSFDELIEALHITLEEMACSYHKGIEDIPIRRWREGVRRFPLRMPLNLNEFNAQVSLRATRVIGRLGIEYKGLDYCNEQLVELRRSLGVKLNVTILIKPEDIREIYVVAPATQRVISVPCTRRYENPLPLFLHEENRRLRIDTAKLRTEDLTGAQEVEDIAGAMVEDKEFRRSAMKKIEEAARTRIGSFVIDKESESEAQVLALKARQRMSAPPSRPDNRKASIQRGRDILGMPSSENTRTNTEAPRLDKDESNEH